MKSWHQKVSIIKLNIYFLWNHNLIKEFKNIILLRELLLCSNRLPKSQNIII